MRSVLHCLACG